MPHLQEVQLLLEQKKLLYFFIKYTRIEKNHPEHQHQVQLVSYHLAILKLSCCDRQFGAILNVIYSVDLLFLNLILVI